MLHFDKNHQMLSKLSFVWKLKLHFMVQISAICIAIAAADIEMMPILDRYTYTTLVWRWVLCWYAVNQFHNNFLSDRFFRSTKVKSAELLLTLLK